MAQLDIANIQEIIKERPTIHTKVKSTYSVFKIGDDKYVQLDTYGNSGRENSEQVSQTIQLDKESAIYIVKLLIKNFDLLNLNN